MQKPTVSLKHLRQNELHFTPEDLRWATPDIVAKYRAKRLAQHGKVIADIGCGIGFQTFAFAENFAKVYAVDIDKEKIERAEYNAKFLGLKNIIFIHGDALNPKVVAQLSDAEIIFCDPERLPAEEERTWEKIIPNPSTLVALYSPLTNFFAFELPPQIRTIPLSGEKEYLSVNEKLNRLTLYIGGLAKTERSAVVLPEQMRLESNSKAKLNETEKLGKYLLEVNPAIVKAELLAELSQEEKIALFSRQKSVYFTSGKKVNSPFFCHAFQVRGSCQFQDKEIITLLKKIGAGKVTLRFSVDPKEYWKLRGRYEQQLSGEKKVSLFQFGKEAVVGEEA